MKRRSAKTAQVGDIIIGGESPISIQSMTKTKTDEVEKTLAQIRLLEDEGCELVRVAVPNKKSVSSLQDIVQGTTIPIIADIHYSLQLALEAMEQGVHKVRINPGNMTGENICRIVEAARKKDVALRIGINTGSLPEGFLDSFSGSKTEAVVSYALDYVERFENANFENFVISLKASDVVTTVAAYKMLADKTVYPLHLGITEAGDLWDGSIKSSLVLGALLLEGIGDTLRVSLTADPREEIRVAKKILQYLGHRYFGPEIISCPTCGRCEVDISWLVSEVKKSVSHIRQPLKIAVMGCSVNGPGEAREADIGISGGKKYAHVFREGKVIGKAPIFQALELLLFEIGNYEPITRGEN